MTKKTIPEQNEKEIFKQLLKPSVLLHPQKQPYYLTFTPFRT